MSNHDVRTRAQASLVELHKRLNPERMNDIGAVGQCDLRVLRGGEWIPYHKYVRERLAACRDWCRRWAPRLAAVNVEAIVENNPIGALVFLRDCTPEPEPDPWKPSPADLAAGCSGAAASDDVSHAAGLSGGEAMLEIALRKSVRNDDKWTLARIASVPEYRDRCKRILGNLTEQQKDVVASCFVDGLPHWRTAQRCGMANEQRVSELVGRVRREFTDSGLPAPVPAFKRERTDPHAPDPEDEDIDIDRGDHRPAKMLPADPAARRRVWRRNRR